MSKTILCARTNPHFSRLSSPDGMFLKSMRYQIKRFECLTTPVEKLLSFCRLLTSSAFIACMIHCSSLTSISPLLNQPLRLPHRQSLTHRLCKGCFFGLSSHFTVPFLKVLAG